MAGSETSVPVGPASALNRAVRDDIGALFQQCNCESLDWDAGLGMRVAFGLIVFLAVAAGAVAGAAFLEDRWFAQAGPLIAEKTLVVKPGSGVATIAQNLADAGVVDSALLFRVGVVRRGHTAQLKAGEYAFPAHASEAQVMAMLLAHKTLEHRLTIAEGLTSDAAVALVMADPVLTGPVTVTPEGSLLPETYLFERGTTRAELLARMHQAQEKVLAELWPKRKEGLPLASQDDALKARLYRGKGNREALRAPAHCRGLLHQSAEERHEAGNPIPPSSMG